MIFTFFDQSQTATVAMDESSSRAILVDDGDVSSSTIMSKLDVISNRGVPQLAATAETKLNALIEITQSLGAPLHSTRCCPRCWTACFGSSCRPIAGSSA